MSHVWEGLLPPENDRASASEVGSGGRRPSAVPAGPRPATVNSSTSSQGSFIRPDPPLPFRMVDGAAGVVIGFSQSVLEIVPVVGDWSARSGFQSIFLDAMGDGQSPAVLSGLEIESTGMLPPGRPRVLTLRATSAASVRILEDWLGRIRKEQHIRICATQDVESRSGSQGFAKYSFRPVALPEMALADVNTKVEFLGNGFALPMLITGMTGGISDAQTINFRLARAASRLRIPMGVGSQRVAVTNPELARIFQVKSRFPDVFLIGNIGATQLRASLDRRRLVESMVQMIDADAVAIHINVMQELVQVEGDRDFVGILSAVREAVRHSPVPVVVKEVGCGLDLESCARLIDCGVAAIDVGGRGGTSWPFIEGERTDSPGARHMATTFRDWGLDTADCLLALSRLNVSVPIIATGGVRSGLTVAKAVALGARMVGIGLPLLRAALEDEDGPHQLLSIYADELRATMLATASASLAGLSRRILGREHDGGMSV